VVFGGTFNGNPVVLAAASAALDALADGTLLAEANRLGNLFKEGFARIAAARNVDVQVNGFGAAFGIRFGDDKERLAAMSAPCSTKASTYCPPAALYLGAHTEREIEETLAAVDRCVIVTQLMNGKRLGNVRHLRRPVGRRIPRHRAD
jgi:glutamate-1-semialdehyde aminotransferase